MATTTSIPTPPLNPANDARTALLHQVSWGAVFAGAATALVTQVILNLVGVGVGLSLVSPTEGDNPTAGAFSLGAGLWWVISGIVASLAGGFLAGRLSGRPSAATAGYHGLVTWAVTALVVLYLLTSTVGSLIGGAFGTVTSALGGAGQAIGGTVQTAAQAAAPALGRAANPFEGIERQLRQTAGDQDPAVLRDAAVNAVRAYITGDQAQKQQASDRAAEALARAQNVPVDQARRQVEEYQTQYEQAVTEAKKQATTAAEATRSAAAQGALYAALALVLGALAAFFGGRMGTVRAADYRG